MINRYETISQALNQQSETAALFKGQALVLLDHKDTAKGTVQRDLRGVKSGINR